MTVRGELHTVCQPVSQFGDELSGRLARRISHFVRNQQLRIPVQGRPGSHVTCANRRSFRLRHVLLFGSAESAYLVTLAAAGLDVYDILAVMPRRTPHQRRPTVGDSGDRHVSDPAC